GPLFDYDPRRFSAIETLLAELIGYPFAHVLQERVLAPALVDRATLDRSGVDGLTTLVAPLDGVAAFLAWVTGNRSWSDPLKDLHVVAGVHAMPGWFYRDTVAGRVLQHGGGNASAGTVIAIIPAIGFFAAIWVSGAASNPAKLYLLDSLLT